MARCSLRPCNSKYTAGRRGQRFFDVFGKVATIPPMRLTDLVTTSQRVAETRSRSAKTAALADLLRRLGPEEIDPAVSWLSGELRQGRIGLGGAAVRDSRTSAAAAPSLPVGEV